MRQQVREHQAMQATAAAAAAVAAAVRPTAHVLRSGRSRQTAANNRPTCGRNVSNTLTRSNMGLHVWLITSRHTLPAPCSKNGQSGLVEEQGPGCKNAQSTRCPRPARWEMCKAKGDSAQDQARMHPKHMLPARCRAAAVWHVDLACKQQEQAQAGTLHIHAGQAAAAAACTPSSSSGMHSGLPHTSSMFGW